jgi:hypothetical protein
MRVLRNSKTHTSQHWIVTTATSTKSTHDFLLQITFTARRSLSTSLHLRMPQSSHFTRAPFKWDDNSSYPTGVQSQERAKIHLCNTTVRSVFCLNLITRFRRRITQWYVFFEYIVPRLRCRPVIPHRKHTESHDTSVLGLFVPLKFYAGDSKFLNFYPPLKYRWPGVA